MTKTARAIALTKSADESSRRKALLAFLGGLAALLTILAARPAEALESGVAHLNVQQTKQLVAAVPDLKIIDVRTPREFRGGHLAGAVNVDVLAPDFKSRIAKFSREEPVLVYCKSGARSTRATGVMHNLNFRTVYEMDGGFDAWKAAGLPSVRD